MNMLLAVCVCSSDLLELGGPGTPKSLPIRDGDPCAGLEPPALRQQGTPTLQFLSGLSAATGATHRIFLFNL